MKIEPDNAGRPFVYADPRSLSRAWFDALYGRASTPLPAVPRSTSEAPNDSRLGAPTAGARPDAGGHAPPAPPRPSTPLSSGARPAAGTGVGLEGTAPPADAALRRRLQAAPLSKAPRKRLDVTCADAAGTPLRLLLEADAGRVRVVAVCAESAAARVADALERARIMLGARGISLTTRLVNSRNTYD